MKEQEIQDLKKLLNTSKDIVIIPHKNPDGDAIGSTIALQNYLTKLEHKVTIIAPNDFPTFLKWLPLANKVVIFEKETEKANSLIEQANLIFTLDFNNLARCGDLEYSLKKAKAPFVMIDHHQQPDNYATYKYSDTSMSSTCQMVYHFIEMMEHLDLITPEMATCLYTGIMTDTGSFRYRSTTSTTHKVIAHLIESGADNTSIHQKIYDTNTLSKLQLKGVALKNLQILPEYKTAYITLSQKELNQNNYKKGDTEGFVNIGLSLEKIVFAVIFIENEQEGIIKISFRSKGNFSVNEYARNHFEGGGHNNAAGGKSNQSLSKTIDFFISTLLMYKTSLLKS